MHCFISILLCVTQRIVIGKIAQVGLNFIVNFLFLFILRSYRMSRIVQQVLQVSFQRITEIYISLVKSSSLLKHAIVDIGNSGCKLDLSIIQLIFRSLQSNDSQAQLLAICSYGFVVRIIHNIQRFLKICQFCLGSLQFILGSSQRTSIVRRVIRGIHTRDVIVVQLIAVRKLILQFLDHGTQFGNRAVDLSINLCQGIIDRTTNRQCDGISAHTQQQAENQRQGQNGTECFVQHPYLPPLY